MVEELASILWRKRRVLAAEGAQINSGIACAMTNSLRVANQATPFLPKITRNELLGDEALPVREILALDAEGLEQRRQALEALPSSLTDLWYAKDRYGETIYQVDRFSRL